MLHWTHSRCVKEMWAGFLPTQLNLVLEPAMPRRKPDGIISVEQRCGTYTGREGSSTKKWGSGPEGGEGVQGVSGGCAGIPLRFRAVCKVMVAAVIYRGLIAVLRV
jgi:hypothetical protein